MKKIIGIFVCTLLIATVIPVTGQLDISIKKDNDEISPCSNGDKWMKTFGGSGYNCGNSVQQTSDGGYIIVGQTSPPLEFEYNLWLIKTDGMGNKIWDKKFGGDGHDRGESVKQTSDGGYIITGSTESYGAGNRDIWLIKTDSNGNMVWDKTFGNSENDSGFEVIEISSGGYIIVGSTHLNEPWYRADLWLIKTDSNGNMIWDKTFEDEGHGVGMSVQEVNDGGFIITGQISSTGYADLWLLKTDSEGELLWDKKFDKYDHVDMGDSVKQTADGGFITGGSSLSDGLSVYDAWLIKTDSEGNLLWDKTFGGNGHDFGYSVQQTSDGGYIIAGFTEDIFFRTDGLLIKTGSNGEKEWIKTYRLSRSGIIYSAQQTTDGGYILTGPVSYNVLSDDIWLVKTDANGDVPTSRARNLLKFRLLELFPNLFKILEKLLG
ncbi:MAG: hypothetical protein KAW45_08395 [Thermoplasmatales archaeon]|nr:hypothetical protein [Thermoplasmatales archaeon]